MLSCMTCIVFHVQKHVELSITAHVGHLHNKNIINAKVGYRVCQKVAYDTSQRDAVEQGAASSLLLCLYFYGLAILNCQ